jgi:hypothetical protein
MIVASISGGKDAWSRSLGTSGPGLTPHQMDLLRRVVDEDQRQEFRAMRVGGAR